MLSAAEGRRAHGAMEVCGENGGILLGIRDFWQKYPSAVEACDLDQDNAEVIFWLWCPQVEAMDFRHYADQTDLLHIQAAFEHCLKSALMHRHQILRY